MQTFGFAVAPGAWFYKGDAANPQIGNVRVRFEIVGPQTVSLIALQRGTTLETYHAKAGSDVLLVESGSVPSDRMFQAAQTTNKIWTWVGRAGGFLLMFIGLVLVLRPLSVLGSVIPMVGSFLGAGTGLVALFIALTLSLTTMALAWLAYRPLLGGGLLLLAGGSVVLLLRAHRKKAAVVPPPVPAIPPIPQA